MPSIYELKRSIEIVTASTKKNNWILTQISFIKLPVSKLCFYVGPSCYILL